MIYKHSGDLGDIVYSLPVIKEMGGGILNLASSNQTRTVMDRKQIANIRPLLEAQPYIYSVAPWAGLPVDVDLDYFREYWDAHVAYGKSLAQYHVEAFQLDPEILQSRWLTIGERKDGKELPDPLVVINRTQRYHNGNFNWKLVVEKYKGHVVFVGSENEWKEFVAECGHVPFFRTVNLLEMARVIAASNLFIGNQSCAYAIAEGLKVNTIQETWPTDPNCRFDRHNARYCPGSCAAALSELYCYNKAYQSIGLVTLVCGKADEYGWPVAEAKQAYCKSHGYGFHWFTEQLVKDRHPAWSKIKAILAVLDRYDWIFWTDADAHIVRPSVEIEKFIDQRYDLILSSDQNGLNTGNFLVRNCDFTRQLLQECLQHEEVGGCWEQSTLQAILKAEPSKMARVKLAGDAFNSYHYCKDPDFIVHLAGESHEFRVDYFKRLGLPF